MRMFLAVIVLPVLSFLLGFVLHRYRNAGTFCEARTARTELAVLGMLFAVSLVAVLS